MVRVISRAEWGARSPTKSLPRWSRRPEYIVWHHTVSPGCGVLAEGQEAAFQRMMQASHMSRGWGDIGQHYTVYASGRVYESRPLAYQGVHAAGANSYTIGIEHQGDFRYCRPTAEQIQSSAELIAGLYRYFRWDPHETWRIQPHRRFSRTACPVYLEAVDQVRDVVQALLLYGGAGRGANMASSRETRLVEPGHATRSVVFVGQAYGMTYSAWVHATRAIDDQPTRVHLREIDSIGQTRLRAWLLDEKAYAASRAVSTSGNVVVDFWVPEGAGPAYVVIEQVTY